VSGRNQISKAEIREAEDHIASANTRYAFRLAGGIAHDLNTILTTVYGYCEMALESLDEASPASHNVRRIIDATDRARQLTGRLLDLDRASSEEKLRVKVSDIIEDTVGFLKPTVHDNISLSLQMKSPDLMVEAIPSQLFRAFMNIAVNALNAMEEGGGSLTVTLDAARAGEGEEAGVAKESARPGEGCTHALIRFADTGAGMDQETASRIFEPYYTGDTGKGGTGLGLTVVNDIITEMNGTMKVRSELGKGTVIDLLIPAVVFGSHHGKS
jgi:two-component system cell cycle sensor histidine kinase/response regulator CckA